MLVSIIKEFLEKPQAFVSLERLSFPAKVELANAIGALLDGYAEPLMVLNGLRNRFAHNIDAKITESDENKLLESMPTDDQAKITGGRNVRYTLAYLHGSLYGGLYTIRTFKKSNADKNPRQSG